MDKAEERALEAYPVKNETFHEPDIHYKADTNAGFRKKFLEGYRQAEKDLALTSDDIKFIIDKYSELPIQYSPTLFNEILKQFNERSK